MILYALAIDDPDKQSKLQHAAVAGDEEANEVLRSIAVALLRVSRLTPADFVACDGPERAALVSAAEVIRREDAQLYADMMTGGKVAAAAMAPVDGGARLEDEICRDLLSRCA